jgi:hypothetical protein
MADENTTGKALPPKVSGIAWTMIVIALVVMSLVAIHLNWARWRQDKIEKVIVTPIPTPAASPSANP